MYDNLGAPPGMQRQPSNAPPNALGGPFYGPGSGLIRDGLAAYGGRILGSSSEYLQSNGHWTRIAEQMGGKLSYKPPIYDINAPDLYIPLMAFGTYVVLVGFALGLNSKFSPEALSMQFTKGLGAWLLQVTLLKFLLYLLGSGEAGVLDVVAYGGYAFIGISLSVLARALWSYSYYFVMPWTCLCMGIFLVKTMKRILFAELRSYDKSSSKNHYLLLLAALAQFPLFFWLGYVGP
ncbi:protein YIF1B-B isoform X2 [Amborella trichopoda]|uniref:protein YIF1B-B isoform X2 n=1 Tax=Amborella trichopoda TaxID=13333 RepID=UPI0005D46819|nr:protein YIF1B-B isoform X2 [Amborella trichopoda]XP_020531259.1 protein YIF1B-B isoform X2 [Amborella trichopoda]|eukprot:XP_011628246.1 protein YIF1B-B isoform X2 [Amborella trichopoda]